MRKAMKKGFTLIELMMVIVILAIISSLAISKFVDLRKRSAKKVNVSSMQNLQRAVETYILSTDQQVGSFAKLESLLDVGGGGSWTGTAGTYDWTKNGLDAIPGIYRGPKTVTRITNANGQGTESSDSATLEDQRQSNQGITETLAGKLGIYYLTADDAAAFKKAGISNYVLHNYTAGQSSALGFTTGDGNMALVNGGPGIRGDMTAFYPSILTNGSPVVILNPAKCNETFRNLGCDMGLGKTDADTYLASRGSSGDPEGLYTKNLCTYRLFVFGLGRTCTFAQNALDTLPRSEVYGREYYRNYLLVFKQSTMAQQGKAISFAGVLDCDGYSIEEARFQADWWASK
ncbi:MAG: type II secretion system protein [Kiritimatiellae bacterium]|nr:type II secretion system protein [Kiritimatiellia bacterium]